MGLSQWIIRNSDGVTPTLDDNGEWVNGTECLELRKCYWLRNHLNPYVKKTTGKDISDMCAEFIPIPISEIEDVITDAKIVIGTREESVAMNLFDTGLFYTDFDFELFLEVLRYFNRVMSNRLKSKKETYYWYVESW